MQNITDAVQDTETIMLNEDEEKELVAFDDGDPMVTQVLHWNNEFKKIRESVLMQRPWTMQSLTKLMRFYIRNVCISAGECYTRPLQAAKLRDSISETLILFLYIYRDISEGRNKQTYLSDMSDLLAVYIDMELKASRKSKEDHEKVCARITSCLYVYLEYSPEHLLDTLIKVQFMYRSYHHILDPIISKMIKNLPQRPESSNMYTRYFLVYRLWRKINTDEVARNEITAIAVSSLGPPPISFPPNALRNVLPKVLKAQSNSPRTLMEYKFDLKRCCEAFIQDWRQNNRILNPLIDEDVHSNNSQNKPLPQVSKPQPEDKFTNTTENNKSTLPFNLNKSDKSFTSSNHSSTFKSLNVDAQSNFRHGNNIEISTKQPNSRPAKFNKCALKRTRKKLNEIVIIDLTNDIAFEKCIKKRKCRKLLWLEEAKKRVDIRPKPIKQMDKWEAQRTPRLPIIRRINNQQLEDESACVEILGHTTSTEEITEPKTTITEDCNIQLKKSQKNSIPLEQEEKSSITNETECQRKGNSEINCQAPSSSCSCDTNIKCTNKKCLSLVCNQTDEVDSHTQVVVDKINPEGSEENMRERTMCNEEAENVQKDINYESNNSMKLYSAIEGSRADTLSTNRISSFDGNELVINTNSQEEIDKRVTHFESEMNVSQNTNTFTQESLCIPGEMHKKSDLVVSSSPILMEEVVDQNSIQEEAVIHSEDNEVTKEEASLEKIGQLDVSNQEVNYQSEERQLTIPECVNNSEDYDNSQCSGIVGAVNENNINTETNENVYFYHDRVIKKGDLLDTQNTRKEPVANEMISPEVTDSLQCNDINIPIVNVERTEGQCYFNRNKLESELKDEEPCMSYKKSKIVELNEVDSIFESRCIIENTELRDDIDGLSLLAAVSQQVPHLRSVQKANYDQIKVKDYASLRNKSEKLTNDVDTTVDSTENNVIHKQVDCTSTETMNALIGIEEGEVYDKVAVEIEVSSTEPSNTNDTDYGPRGNVFRYSDNYVNYDGDNMLYSLPSIENNTHTTKENANVILNGETVVLLQKSPNSNLYIINKAVENLKESNNEDEAIKLKERSWISSQDDPGQLDAISTDRPNYDSDLLLQNNVSSYQETKFSPGHNKMIKVEQDDARSLDTTEAKAYVQKMPLMNDVDPNALNVGLDMSKEKRKASKSNIVFRQNIKQEFNGIQNHTTDNNIAGYSELHPHSREIDPLHIPVTHSVSIPPIYGNCSGNTDLCVLCHKHCTTVSCSLQINTSASLYTHTNNTSNPCGRSHCSCLNCTYDFVTHCRKCISVHSGTDTHVSCIESNPYFLSTHSSVQTPTVQEHDNSKNDPVIGKLYGDQLYYKIEKNFLQKTCIDKLEKQRTGEMVPDKSIDNKLPLKKRLKAHAMMAMVYEEIEIKSEESGNYSTMPTTSAAGFTTPNTGQYKLNKLHVSSDDYQLKPTVKEDPHVSVPYLKSNLLKSDCSNAPRTPGQSYNFSKRSIRTHDCQFRSTTDLCDRSAYVGNTFKVPNELKEVPEETPCKKLKKTHSPPRQTRSSKRNVPKVNYCYTDIDPEWSPSGETRRKRKKTSR